MPVLILDQFSISAQIIFAALAVLSIYAATVVIAKLLQFRAERVGHDAASRSILALLRAGRGIEAIESARTATGLRARALAQALDPQGGAETRQMRATQVALDGLTDLARYLRGLEAVVQAAPMLGLLGTVVGMIEAFATLAATSGAADPSVLAGGIWTALMTTALGLAIAIVFYFLSLWLESRVAAERAALDSALMQALALTATR